ncbi:hypothetical protein KY312_01110, partial [Candidatus Woesearchaeota archaeon]|nr:hypothetical protein [Candidatus Woesearchaeota archaeon]
MPFEIFAKGENVSIKNKNYRMSEKEKKYLPVDYFIKDFKDPGLDEIVMAVFQEKIELNQQAVGNADLAREIMEKILTDGGVAYSKEGQPIFAEDQKDKQVCFIQRSENDKVKVVGGKGIKVDGKNLALEEKEVHSVELKEGLVQIGQFRDNMQSFDELIIKAINARMYREPEESPTKRSIAMAIARVKRNGKVILTYHNCESVQIYGYKIDKKEMEHLNRADLKNQVYVGDQAKIDIIKLETSLNEYLGFLLCNKGYDSALVVSDSTDARTKVGDIISSYKRLRSKESYEESPLEKFLKFAIENSKPKASSIENTRVILMSGQKGLWEKLQEYGKRAKIYSKEKIRKTIRCSKTKIGKKISYCVLGGAALGLLMGGSAYLFSGNDEKKIEETAPKTDVTKTEETTPKTPVVTQPKETAPKTDVTKTEKTTPKTPVVTQPKETAPKTDVTKVEKTTPKTDTPSEAPEKTIKTTVERIPETPKRDIRKMSPAEIWEAFKKELAEANRTRTSKTEPEHGEFFDYNKAAKSKIETAKSGLAGLSYKSILTN